MRDSMYGGPVPRWRDWVAGTSSSSRAWPSRPSCRGL